MGDIHTNLMKIVERANERGSSSKPIFTEPEKVPLVYYHQCINRDRRYLHRLVLIIGRRKKEYNFFLFSSHFFFKAT